MPAALLIVFGAAITVAASYTLGRLLLDALRVRLYGQEETLFSFITGAACLHLVVFALMSAQLAYTGVFLAVAASILLGGWLRGAFRSSTAPKLPALPPLWKWIFAAVYAVYAFLYLSNSMAPEMSPDGSAYHLGLVSRYLREHGFSRITTNMYANLTQGIEMLYAFAFAFGRHSAAATVHCAFTLAMPLLMMAHARRYGFTAAGAGGALLFLCSPVVGIDGTTAYNDVAVVTVVFAMFSLLQIWADEKQPGLVPLIGLLAGFCFATKYTAALAIPFAGAFLLWKNWRHRKPWLKSLLVFSACVALMAVPWAAKNWIIVGNPLSPFFNKWFPNPGVTIGFEQEYIERMRHYGDPKSYWDVPLDLTVHGAMLAGMLGPVFVLTPLALFALRYREGRRLLLAALIFAVPYANNIGTRFLLPALPFLSLALGLVMVRLKFVLPLLVVTHAVISWPHVLAKYCSPYAWRLERVPVAAALRITPEEKYLSERHWGYPFARMIEKHVPPDEKIFSFSGVPEAYLTRDFLTGYQAAFNNTLSEFVWVGLFPDTAPLLRTRLAFPSQPIRQLKLVLKKPSTEQWNVAEFHILHKTEPIERTPEWRLRARPNPWDVQMAFDNTPVTRWRTQEPSKSDMFVEVDLGSDRVMDAIVLEQSKDQISTQLELHGRSDKGTWKLLADKLEFSETPRPRGLRRAAMEELRARGVRYVFAMSDDPAAKDYNENRALWGLTLLAEHSGARLYFIEPSASLPRQPEK
jgi:hypothetical protein